MSSLEKDREPSPGGGPSRTGTDDIPNRDVTHAASGTVVLVVEDDPAHAELARRAFDSRPGVFSVAVVQTVEQARQALGATVPPDVVIADWRLPDGEGVDLLRGDTGGGLPPIVIMTSQGSERVAVEVMRAGAADYVVKSEATLADLAHVAERALRQRRIEEAVGDIAAGTSGTGEAFFQSIVLRLARVLRVRYASVAELLPGGRLRTLACCLDGRLADDLEHGIDRMPCARVLSESVYYVRSDLQKAFPNSEMLRRLRAESYIGAALLGATGTPLGVVSAIHDRPLDEVVRPEVVARVFASRAAAELERRRATAELEKQRLFAESLLDMVASLVMVVDTTGRIVRFNRACETTSGWKEAEVRGRRFWEVLRPPEGREESARHFGGDASFEGLPPTYETTWLTRAGDRRLISWVARPITDERGRVSLVIGTGVDITDSRRTEEALRESEARYRTLMQNAPEAIVVADLGEGRIVDANANAEALFDLEREQLLQTDPGTLLPEWQPGGEAWDVVWKRRPEQTSEGETSASEVVELSTSGRARPCEMRLVHLPGPRNLVRISLVDIGERERLEADLRRAALEWRRTFDGLPLGVVVVDGEGRVVRANRTAVVHSGRSSWSDLIDTPLARIGAGEIWVALGELVDAMRSGARPAPREIRDSSTRRTWVVSASSLPTDEDGPGRVVLNFQDVSETVELKERLRQSETMAAVGSIVAGVAHEVRNPLFSISATLDAFASRFGDTESYAKYLSVLRGEIDRLTTLMKDLLEFGRPSEPEFGRWEPAELVRSAIENCGPLLEEKGVRADLMEPGEVPRVLADRVRMTQVLQNLVENAIHYSPPGGRVEVVLGPGGDAGGDWGEFVECAVRDSGPGFAPADLEQLFEPFFTRRRGGTGLGLSIVKRIVYDHGGEVFARNHPEGGAVVAVWLRRAEP